MCNIISFFNNLTAILPSKTKNNLATTVLFLSTSTIANSGTSQKKLIRYLQLAPKLSKMTNHQVFVLSVFNSLMSVI